MNKRISLFLWALLSLVPMGMVYGEVEFPSLGEGNPYQRYPGKIIWHDLFTSVPGEMAAFYETMFGWESEAHELNGRKVYLMWSGGYPVAAIVERAKVDGDQEGGIWIAYASVNSVDSVSSAVIAAGGRILVQKGQFPGRGEHAILQDDQGAIFGVLKSASGDPGEYMPNIGDFFWAQHLSGDAQVAANFYETVGNYKVVKDKRFQGPQLFLLSSGGFARAGLSPLADNAPVDKADWIHFIRVESIEETLANLSSGGAKVLLPPDEDILEGRLAILTDPSGALVGIMQAAPNPSTEEAGQ
ncbi:MAG: VOC family protein [Puniceicoccaceae bacterium]